MDDAKPAATKTRKRINSQHRVLLTPEQKDIIRAAADFRGLSVSEFLRQAALQVASLPLVKIDLVTPPTT